MGLAPRQSYPRYSSKWDFSSDAQEFRKYAYAKNLSFLSFFVCLLLPLLPRKIIPRASAILPRETQFKRGPIFVSRSVLSIAKLGFFRSTYRRNPRRWDESWSFFPFLPLLNFLASGETSFSGEREREGEKPKKLPTLLLLAQFWNAVLVVVVEKSLIEYDGCGEGEGQATSFSRNKRSSIIIIHPPNQAEAISGVRSVIALVLLKRKAF